MLRLIYPPVHAASPEPEIRAWLEELAVMEAAHGIDDGARAMLEWRRAEALAWLEAAAGRPHAA